MPTHTSRLSPRDRGTSRDNLHNGPRLEGPGTSECSEAEIYGPFQGGASGRFGHGTLNMTDTPEEQPPLTLPRFVIVDQETARHTAHCMRVPQFHGRLTDAQQQYRIDHRQHGGLPGTQLCIWFMEYTEGSTPQPQPNPCRYFARAEQSRAERLRTASTRNLIARSAGE
jgi:hypothetical protein